MPYQVLRLNISNASDHKTNRTILNQAIIQHPYEVTYEDDHYDHPLNRTWNHPDHSIDVSDITYGYASPFNVIITLILLSFIIFAVAGNVLVIIAILTDRNLRRTSNFFIISLAVADTLVAIAVMTFSVINEILGRWIFGATFCNIWISSDVMCSTASIMNLCAISLDRYIHIRNPLHYDMWITKNRTLLVISGIWITSGLISFLPIHLGWHQLGKTVTHNIVEQDKNIMTSIDNDIYQCVLDLSPIYAVISSTVSFFLPCIMMISIYIKMYRYARVHVESIKKSRLVHHPSGSRCSPRLDEGSPDAKSRLSEHKAAVTLGVIMGVFLFCWAPFFTANVIGAFCEWCVPPMLFSVFTWLGYMNSTMNPVIYSVFNQEFSRAFKKVLLSGRRCFRGGQRDPRFGSEDFRTERVPLNTFSQRSVMTTDRELEMRHERALHCNGSAMKQTMV